MDYPTEIFKKLNFFCDQEFQSEVISNGEFVSLKKGDIVVKEGQYVKFLPIVISGAILVFQQRENREILLYYVRPEETCTMSLAAAYFENKSSSHGVATELTEALIFPSNLIMEWQLKFPSWNKYVMRMFRNRYDEMIGALEKVAFEPVHVRIMEYLRKKSQNEGKNQLAISHQNLAFELGTTRVVVSRILKHFENNNKIKLHRGLIELL